MAQLTITLKVKPGARHAAAPVWRDKVLELAVQAPPVEGKANIAVIKALSELFKCPKSAIELTAGLSGRHKRACLTFATNEGLAAAEAMLDSLTP